jgi:TonB family protein
LVRAEKLPLPDYPEAGRQAGLRGSVSVDVTLDEEGKVLYAENATPSVGN